MVQAVDKIWNIQGMIQGMIQALVQYLQPEAYDLQVVQEVFTCFIRFWIFGWNTKGTGRCCIGWGMDG